MRPFGEGLRKERQKPRLLILDQSYRLQIAWSGKHFLLYVRSLINGVTPDPSDLLDLPYYTQSTHLELPQSREQVDAFRLEPTELLDFLKKGENNSIYAGDVLWLESVVRWLCLLYTSPSPRDQRGSRMPSSA